MPLELFINILFSRPEIIGLIVAVIICASDKTKKTGQKRSEDIKIASGNEKVGNIQTSNYAYRKYKYVYKCDGEIIKSNKKASELYVEYFFTKVAMIVEAIIFGVVIISICFS